MRVYARNGQSLRCRLEACVSACSIQSRAARRPVLTDDRPWRSSRSRRSSRRPSRSCARSSRTTSSSAGSRRSTRWRSVRASAAISTEVHFKDGALVKKGDLLFTIDQRPYQAAYDAGKVAGRCRDEPARFQQAATQRAEELAKTGNLPTSTLDDRRREYLAAEAGFQGATAALRRRPASTSNSPRSRRRCRAASTAASSRSAISSSRITTLLTTIVAQDPIDFYFDVDERALPRLCAATRARAAAACRRAPAASTSRCASPTARDAPSTASSISPRTASTRRPARCACAPASTIRTACCSPACSAASTCRARCPIKGVMLPDEAIGADQDRRIVYVVDDRGQCQRQAGAHRPAHPWLPRHPRGPDRRRDDRRSTG